jgi:pimeloyl-ACP methyl ester carboxylesterase
MKQVFLAAIISCLATVFSASAQNKAFSVKVTGKGDPVFLFPGFACTADVWEQTIAAIAANNECHAFTFAGFGGVQPIDTPWLPVIKQQIVAYVKNKKLKNITIIGHSLGGTLGMWLASTETTMFKKLIAVDALPGTGALMVPNFKASDMVYNNPYSKQQLNMDSTSFLTMAKQMAAGMCLTKTKQQQIINWMMMADRKTYVYGYIDLLKLDLREELANIKIPVVVLAATYPNKQMVEETWNKQLTKLNNKTVYYADNAAHFIMFDQPEWLITKIKENLQ